MPTFNVSDIVWDTDGEDVALPKATTIEADDEEDVLDALSDEYGWLIESCTIRPAKNK